MRRIAAVTMMVAATAAGAADGSRTAADALWEDVKQDHAQFYSGWSLANLGGGLLVAGVLANSSADEDARSSGTNDWAGAVKWMGEGILAVPLMACASALAVWGKEFLTCGAIGEWGQRSLRSVFVGAPPVLLLQRALGASRPSDDEADSKWRPFEDSNGVSGHAFIGAVPFLTAGRMTDSLALKSACYAASALCGLSRINDDDHYLSQVAMGWWLAWLAVDAVDRTEAGRSRVRLTALARPDLAGVGLQIEF
ncbi:MAG: phosphatase PAP2 family protein [Verrucomicrobiota bacterium]|nr:phosphatase PAP2 family protein [Verrucomicrobiota bacterium]